MGKYIVPVFLVGIGFYAIALVDIRLCVGISIIIIGLTFLLDK